MKAGRPSDAAEITSRRIEEAKEASASLVVTTCPFGVRNLADGAQLIGFDIEILTIGSLVSELTKPQARRLRKKE